MARFSYYYHTIKHLKFQQAFWRLFYKFYKVTVNSKFPDLLLRKKSAHWNAPPKNSHFIDQNTVTFLNQPKNIASSNCWNDPASEKLWLYNLHYFDDLNAVDAEFRKDWHLALMQRWVQENPISMGNGWEPYTLSLRIVNWIKWALAGNDLTPVLQQSLAVQARFLSKKIEWHILGNHILANAKALVFAGLFFQGIESEQWLRKGLKILQRQLPEQILADGAHFELSPMYQGIVLEDLLDLVQLYRLYQKPIRSEWFDSIAKMFGWLKMMCHPDGEIAFFNDAAFGVAPTLKALEEYAEITSSRAQRGDPGVGLKPGSPRCARDDEDGGYQRLENDQAVLIADLAPIGPDYLPGHAHADTLSFELSLYGQRIFVNSGTSTYWDNALRHEQRGTAAHNTVMIDDQNSSEVWASFRVARRAKVFDIKKDGLFLQASHNGYRRLPGKLTHTRNWRLESNQLTICDLLQGKGEHDLKIFFHLHPGVSIQQLDEHHAVIIWDNHRVNFSANYAIQILDGYFYPGFNQAVPNKKILIHVKQALPVSIDVGIVFPAMDGRNPMPGTVV